MTTYLYVNVSDGTTVNLRDKADRYNSNVIERVPHATRVTSNFTLGSYTNVTAPSGNTGYIESTYLSTTQPSGGSSSGGSSSGSKPWESRYGTTVWKKANHSNKFYQEVQNLQKDLRKVGYTSITNADGYYGSITEAAVTKFQKNWGLSQDGVCGDATKETLWNHPDR